MKRGAVFGSGVIVVLSAACAASGSRVQKDPGHVAAGIAGAAVPVPVAEVQDVSWSSSPADDADLRDAARACATSIRTFARLPVCEVSEPTGEEIRAFAREGLRLRTHPNERCRLLGNAVDTHLSNVRMYEWAVVFEAGGRRVYGVGHSYKGGREWNVRIARKFNEMNPRSMHEKTRTLRHELSHTLGAQEDPSGPEWTADEYADRCA